MMIVDDSMIARAVLSRMIESDDDFEIAAVAGTAEDAIEALHAVSVDIILLDLEMPGAGGLNSIPLIIAAAGGARIMIVSSLADEGAEQTVAALALDTEPSIVDASHVEHAKPEPDLLLLAAHQLEVEPARCWYVGDSTWDMVAAAAAGMIPIGVTAGAGVDERALRDAGAAVVVGTLIDLAQSLAVPHGSG